MFLRNSVAYKKSTENRIPSKDKRDPKYLKGLCHAIILLPLAIFFSTHQLNSKNNDPGLLFYTILDTETISYHFLPQMAKMDLHNLKQQKSPINCC